MGARGRSIRILLGRWAAMTDDLIVKYMYTHAHRTQCLSPALMKAPAAPGRPQQPLDTQRMASGGPQSQSLGPPRPAPSAAEMEQLRKELDEIERYVYCVILCSVMLGGAPRPRRPPAHLITTGHALSDQDLVVPIPIPTRHAPTAACKKSARPTAGRAGARALRLLRRRRPRTRPRRLCR